MSRSLAEEQIVFSSTASVSQINRPDCLHMIPLTNTAHPDPLMGGIVIRHKVTWTTQKLLKLLNSMECKALKNTVLHID